MKVELGPTDILERQTARRYTEIAPAYRADWRGQLDKQQLRVMRKFEALIGSPPKTILDAGCGTGKHSAYFTSQGYRVIGVDLSLGMLQQAIENSPLQEAPINPIIANMRLLSIKDQTVDGVWSVASIVHLPLEAKAATIQQFHRVLKPEGVLHLGVQNLFTPKHLKRLGQSYLCRLGYDDNNEFYLDRKSLTEILTGPSLLDRLKLGYAFLDDRHWFYPTKFSLLKLLRETGFSIIESNHPFSRRLSFFAVKQSDESMGQDLPT